MNVIEKKLWIIPALLLVLALAACPSPTGGGGGGGSGGGGSGGGGGGGGGGTSLTLTGAVVMDFDGSTPPNATVQAVTDKNNILISTGSVTNGQLSISVGTPPTASLRTLGTDLFAPTSPPQYTNIKMNSQKVWYRFGMMLAILTKNEKSVIN